MHRVALPIRAGWQVLVVLCGLETAEEVDSKTRAVSLYIIAQEIHFRSYLALLTLFFNGISIQKF